MKVVTIQITSPPDQLSLCPWDFLPLRFEHVGKKRNLVKPSLTGKIRVKTAGSLGWSFLNRDHVFIFILAQTTVVTTLFPRGDTQFVKRFKSTFYTTLVSGTRVAVSFSVFCLCWFSATFIRSSNGTGLIYLLCRYTLQWIEGFIKRYKHVQLYSFSEVSKVSY